MFNNIQYGVTAIAQEAGIFMIDLIQNKFFVGFSTGLIIAILIVGFILTKNPAHIPLILRFSSLDAFNRIAERDETGTYLHAYIDFLKLHSHLRIIYLGAFITFCLMVTIMLITQ